MEVTVRPLAEADVDAAREVQTRSFAAHDRAYGDPVPPVNDAVIERQRGRFRHFLNHDPQGSWVAVADGAVLGTALALRRDSLWGLSLLAVDPEAQSRGIGRQLLAASLRYADGVDTAVILSSRDPRAIRSYATAGFDLHPQIRAHGQLDRSVLPRPDPRVRTGDASRADWADDVDRAVRGAARGADHQILTGLAQMFVVDDTTGRGYAYLRADGRIVTVAATDDETATALLWQCLAIEQDVEREIDHVNAGQQWAVRVALAARLTLEPAGPVFWRGRTPPASYLPDGAYL
ncbi:MAG TPA: GNAT family N-acetyltransferase [Mycobacteriales bacterium]|nr:GNAT family N-acetyltransferase [Mycobacteriales bacterium]